jgi:hypothetical protein
MKRPFPLFEVLGLTAALALAGACSPNTSVKPGAPVLTEIKLVENGSSVTTIPASVAECPATAIGGSDAGINGGMCDPSISICRLTSASNWCRCVPNPAPAGPTPPGPDCVDGGLVDAGTPAVDAGADAGADASSDAASDAAAPLGGTWNCGPFSPATAALFVFDRLLDTAPLGDGAASGATDLSTLTIAPPSAATIALGATYNSNGSPNEIIFPLLGDFFSDGPGLFFVAQPALPQSSIISMALDPTKVRAKDGKTAFASSGLLDGSLAFTTAPFSGAVTATPVPPPPAADAGVCAPPPSTVPLDMTPIVLTFNNIVNPAAIGTHVTLTATAPGGAVTPVPYTPTSGDGLNVSITPNANWPASSVINFTLDAAAADVLGETIGAPGLSATFTTSAM